MRIANEHLEELASLDGLTGLANRRGFDRQLEQEWRRAGEINEPVALMMIDDKAALRLQLLEWAEIGTLRRILVSHGEPIEGDPRQALRDLAASLD